MLGKIIIVVVCTAVVGVSAWATRHEPTPFWPGENAVERSIEMVADGSVLHYQENLFWSENQFSEIMENQAGFRSAQINQFNETYDVDAGDFNVEFDQDERFTVLSCDIYGTEYDTSSYNFHWFLGRLPFDLYAFEEFETKLVYHGKIDNIQTVITLKFPYFLNHCHEHVWPK
jgi:hypothetical protein